MDVKLLHRCFETTCVLIGRHEVIRDEGEEKGGVGMYWVCGVVNFTEACSFSTRDSELGCYAAGVSS